MSPFAWSIIGVGMIALAVVARGDVRIETVVEGANDDLVVPAGVYRVAGLGSDAAAGDLAWLRLVQLIGSNQEEKRRYAHVPRNAVVVAELDPTIQSAVYYGAVLGIMNSDVAADVERLLQMGEAAHPQQPEYPMLLGTLYHHVLNDTARARPAYHRSLDRGGPPLIASVLERLDRTETSCGLLAAQMRNSASALVGVELDPSTPRVLLEGCYASKIRSALLRYRLQFNRDPSSVDELVDQGLLVDVSAPPGSCWVLRQSAPILEECR
jgi:hypothetical protein